MSPFWAQLPWFTKSNKMNWKQLLTENRIRESKRQQDARSAFESDFGRIVFSPAMRRMHDKTQVFPLTHDDNIHSRLTHSMEVMALGYSFSILFCESEIFQLKTNKTQYELFREIPIILKNSCLIHDIGNPPFGHFGETVIQDFFTNFFKKENPQLHLSNDEQREFIHFDGNAQGLRVLTKLEYIDDCFGLNLTCPTLASCIKYPNYQEIDKSRIETKKIGVYQSEKKYLDNIAQNCGLIIDGRIVRHPLCYLVEAADSICYLTMDLDDGYNKGLYTLDELHSCIGKDIPIINNIMTSVETNTAKIAKIRNALITELVNIAFQNFENNIEQIENGTFNQELIFFNSLLAHHLQKFCIEKIFSIEEIYSLELIGHSVITGLLDFYMDCLFFRSPEYRKRAIKLIPESIINLAIKENAPHAQSFNDLTDYYKLRILVDYISGMTDKYALRHFQDISGQRR